MKQSFVLLTILQLLSIIAAHPFIIINTKTEALRMVPTHIIRPRQGGLLDQWASAINSALGIPDPDASTSSTKNSGKATASSPATPPAPATPSAVATRTVQTLAPPVTASATSSSSSTNFRSGLLPVTSLTASSSTATSTTSSSSSTSTSISTSTSTTDSSTSTSTTSTSTDTTSTSTPPPSSTLPLVQPTTSPVASSSDNNGNSVPKAGIAIAVIMIVLIALVAAWLVFRYNSRIQAWWTAREEKRRQERSYREALDGPNAGSPNLRQEALGGGDQSRRRTMLQSFFAPSTVRLEPGKEIKRKPVNWGAKSPVMANGQSDSEKVPITASAAPMGQHDESSPLSSSVPSAIPPVPALPQASARHIIAELDSTPIVPPVPATHPVSPMSIGRKESLRNLPPISPISPPQETLPTISELPAQRDLPELASQSERRRPGPRAVMMARKGADGVYRLG